MLLTTLLANPASTESVLTDVEAADITTEKETQYMIRSFFKEEDGQDLVEYSLLLAFIGLGAVAILGRSRARSTSFGPR